MVGEFNTALNSHQYVRVNEMIDYRKQKMAGWRVHLLERWFPITEFKTPVVIGTFSISSLATKERWILLRDAQEYGAGWCTPTDISRDYLETKFGKDKRRITTNQYRNFYDHRRSAPLMAFPTTISHGFYIDIKSAYWSILQAVGWDVDYMPGKWLKKKSDMYDFPFPENKMARNCLVSVAADGVSNMRIWTGSELVFKRAGNKFVNKMLWSLVMDVLHGVAYDAIAAGAVYSYTDGFICSADCLERVGQVIRDWGLSASIKFEGETVINGAGSYRIGLHKTKKFEASHARSIRKIEDRADREWLKKRFAIFSKNRKA